MKYISKRFLVAGAFVVTACAQAFAADLPPPPAPPPRAPATYIPAPIPIYNWTGFYLGGNLGYGFSTASTTLSDTAGSTFSGTTNNSFLGGGQVGVIWEFWGGLVIGAEGDFVWLPNTSNAITATGKAGGINAGSTATGTINSRWLTLADARLGYAFDRLLVYAKGGGAFVGASNTNLTVNPGSVPLALSGPTTNTGWNIGAGLEFAAWGPLTLKAEYNYIQLMSASFTAASTTPATAFSGDVITANNRVINMVTVGFNYKFGGW